MSSPNPPIPDDQETLRALTRWFQTQLDRRNIRFDAEPLSYDGNSAYDFASYRLQAEARTLWLDRFDYAPSQEQLAKAFFAAEIERSLAARRNPLARLLSRLFR